MHLSIFISVINQHDAQNFCFKISLFHASTCFEHMCSSSGGQNHHTYRCDDTRGCVMQFWPPDDEHMCSKHVEAWNKLIVKQKFCASSWLTLILLTWRIWWTNNVSKWQMGFNSAFKGLITEINILYMFRANNCSFSGSYFCTSSIKYFTIHDMIGIPVRSC